jgi:hypothetical protein
LFFFWVDSFGVFQRDIKALYTGIPQGRGVVSTKGYKYTSAAGTTAGRPVFPKEFYTVAKE